MHGERPNRLDLRRPYLFTFLIVALILAVTGTSGAAARFSSSSAAIRTSQAGTGSAFCGCSGRRLLNPRWTPRKPSAS